jgi:hypothetical protein
MDFITDFFTFLWASSVNLVTLLSGGVAVMIELIRRRYGWEVPNNWYVWVVVVCLMFGMFGAWREEHDKVDTKREIEQLRSELAELREGHPYTIPKEDEEEFVEMLLSVGQHDLEIAHADDDEKASALAPRLSDLVKSVGWKVGPLNSPFFTGHLAPGLIILVSREYGTSSPAAARLKAFLARPNINIDAQIQNFNSGEGGLHTLKIFVGPAPKAIKK